MFAATFFLNFFMFAAPLQCTLVVWYSACTTMTNGGTDTVPPLGMEMQIFFVIAAPLLINRSMTNYCVGVSGNGNIINPRWRPNKKRNGHLSPWSRTNIYHLPASRPPLASHWSLPLIFSARYRAV
jgi:hypothetical protein